MIDTYWSDHCRHTTFGTILDDVQIDDPAVAASFDKYMELRGELYVGPQQTGDFDGSGYHRRQKS